MSKPPFHQVKLDITPESEEGSRFMVTARKVCSLDVATTLATYLGGMGMETEIRPVEGKGKRVMSRKNIKNSQN